MIKISGLETHTWIDPRAVVQLKEVRDSRSYAQNTLVILSTGATHESRETIDALAVRINTALREQFGDTSASES